MAKFTDLPSLGQSLAGTEIAALVANVSSTLTTVQLPLSTIKTFVLAGTATTATNVASGSANQIPYQSAANTTAFVSAPVTTGTALIWNGSSLAWGNPGFSTGISGVLKGSSGIVSAATSGTDYAPGTSALATGILKSTTTTGALTIAVAGTDYQSPIGTISGIVKGNGANALTAATAGTDYAPGTSALATGIVKSTTTTGALTIAVAGTDYIAPYTSQTANTVLAAPSGSSGTPSFRALVAADIPSLTSAQLATIVSDETGTGVVVFGTSPAITTSITTASTTFALINTTATTVNFAGGATTALNIGASNAPVTAFAATATTSSTASSLGYLGMPQQSKSSAYTTVIGDAGKHIYVTATATITIDSNANVAYPIGTSIAFIAAAGATVTIAITTDTMYLGGTGTTGSRTLAAYGMATAVKVTATAWFINGTGLT
jgi:hypothetical protein